MKLMKLMKRPRDRRNLPRVAIAVTPENDLSVVLSLLFRTSEIAPMVADPGECLRRHSEELRLGTSLLAGSRVEPDSGAPGAASGRVGPGRGEPRAHGGRRSGLLLR